MCLTSVSDGCNYNHILKGCRNTKIYDDADPAYCSRQFTLRNLNVIFNHETHSAVCLLTSLRINAYLQRLLTTVVVTRRA